jgi:hypothetical protein
MQNCSKCENPFDADKRTPRILINCGHTFCHQCLQSQADCFDCQVEITQPIDSLPKNLALLRGQSGAGDRSIHIPQSELDDSNEPSQILESIPSELCLQHAKKLEAFCHTCLQLLCIDCIIQKSQSEHGKHDISSVEEAAATCKNSILKSKELIQQQIGLVGLEEDKAEGVMGELGAKLVENKQALEKMYSDLHAVIEERRQVALGYLQA